MDNFDSAGKHAPLLNSPRSLEACKRQGIEAHEISYSTLKQFKKSLGVEASQLTPQILQLRYDHHEQKRQEKIRILVEERLRIIDEESRGAWVPGNQLSKHSSNSGGKASMAQGHMASSAFQGSKMITSGPVDSAMLERERQQLEKIKFKQQKEIEQMMEHERKLQEIRLKNEEKLQKEREREQRQQEELFLKQKEQEERRMQDEERKRLAAEREAELQRERQAEQYRREQEKAEQQRLLEAQRQKELRRKEEESKQK